MVYVAITKEKIKKMDKMCQNGVFFYIFWPSNSIKSATKNHPLHHFWRYIGAKLKMIKQPRNLVPDSTVTGPFDMTQLKTKISFQWKNCLFTMWAFWQFEYPRTNRDASVHWGKIFEKMIKKYKFLKILILEGIIFPK